MKYNIMRWLNRDATVLSTGQRATHTYVVGQPGTGKSRALESWILQDMLAGQGLGVLDPHGDLFANLLARLSQYPDLWQRVIVIDPTDPDWAVCIDPLRAVGGYSQQRLALFLTDIVVKIWRVNASTAPRMVWLLTNSFLALSELGLTLLDLPRFLLDTPFREQLLPRLTREAVLTYFHLEYPKNDGAIRQWATPVLNKLGGLLFDSDIRLMLAGGKPLNFRSVLDGRKVLLVNLSKGILGEGASALLGAFIVAQIQKAALSRADSRWRPPFYLYLDEFQNYTTDNIADILSESRKYALSLTLAHQYLDQLPTTLRDAVLNTAGTLVSFRVSRHDATQLAKEIFPARDMIRRADPLLRYRSIGGIPLFNIEAREKALGWDGLAGELANLRFREFWARRRAATRPLRGRTLEVPDVTPTPERQAAIGRLRTAAGQRYGRPKDELRDLVEGRWTPPVVLQGLGSTPDEISVPFWGA